MEKSAFVTECNIIRLYYENAEASIINDLFFETADEETSKIGEIKDKIVAKIKEIIEKIKQFFADIRRKHESAKIKMMLNSECRKSKKMIKAGLHDKEVVAAIGNMYKIYGNTFAEYRKIYDQFMSHRIDYETFQTKMDAVTKHYEVQIDEVAKKVPKVIDTTTPQGYTELMQLTAAVSGVEQAYNKVLDKMSQDVIKSEEAIAATAKHTVSEPTESAATSKFASLTSHINKKVVCAIIGVAGLAGAAAFCFKHGKSKAANVGPVSEAPKATNPGTAVALRNNNTGLRVESADDYFSDIFDDVYDESYDDFEEGANLDARATFKAAKAQVSELNKQIKAQMRSGEYEKAISNCKKVESLMDKTYNELKKIEGTMGSAFLGWFTHGFALPVSDWLINMFVPFGAIYVSIKMMIQQLTQIAKNLDEDIEISPDTFNLYKNQLLQNTKQIKATYVQLERKCSKMKVAAANGETNVATVESADDFEFLNNIEPESTFVESDDYSSILGDIIGY